MRRPSRRICPPPHPHHRHRAQRPGRPRAVALGWRPLAWATRVEVGVNVHPRGCVRPRWTFAPPQLTAPQRSGSTVGRGDDRNPTTPRPPLHPPPTANPNSLSFWCAMIEVQRRSASGSWSARRIECSSSGSLARVAGSGGSPSALRSCSPRRTADRQARSLSGWPGSGASAERISARPRITSGKVLGA